MIDLAAIKERETKVTKGQWRVYNEKFGRAIGTVDHHAQLQAPMPIVTMGLGKTGYKVHIDENDAEFIAHARQDVSDLIEEVERLREALKEVHIENKKLKKDNNVYKLLEIAQPILKLGIPITEQKLSRKNPQLVKRRHQVKQMQRGLIRRNEVIGKLREALSVIQNSDVWEIDGAVDTRGAWYRCVDIADEALKGEVK